MLRRDGQTSDPSESLQYFPELLSAAWSQKSSHAFRSLFAPGAEYVDHAAGGVRVGYAELERHHRGRRAAHRNFAVRLDPAAGSPHWETAAAEGALGTGRCSYRVIQEGYLVDDLPGHRHRRAAAASGRWTEVATEVHMTIVSGRIVRVEEWICGPAGDGQPVTDYPVISDEYQTMVEVR